MSKTYEIPSGKVYYGQACPSCEGKGKYEGLRKVEDPCQECDGEGMVNVEELKPIDGMITFDLDPPDPEKIKVVRVGRFTWDD